MACQHGSERIVNVIFPLEAGFTILFPEFWDSHSCNLQLRPEMNEN